MASLEKEKERHLGANKNGGNTLMTIRLLFAIPVLVGILIGARTALPMTANAGGFERLVVAPHDGETLENSYPCLARLDDGRLFVVWSAARPGMPEKSIVGAFSEDHGRTWSALLDLIAGPGIGAEDPNIIASGKRIIVASTVMIGQGISTSVTKCTRSDDNGRTWSPLYEIPMNHRYTAGKTHRGLRLKSGRLLMGYSWDIFCEESKRLEAEGQMHLRTGMMISDDDGLIWKNGDDFDLEYKPISDYGIRGSAEPAIVDLDDGTIIMLVRTSSDHLYEARSTDEGKTWNNIQPSPLIGHNAPAALCKFDAGKRRGIMCVWNNAKTRFPLCAAASFDGGKTWSKPKDIAGVPGGQPVIYPSCDQAADGTLVAVWTHILPNSADGKSGGRVIRCARFGLDWLLQD